MITSDEVLSELGTVHFGEVAMQPGKPQGFGVVGEAMGGLRHLTGEPGRVPVRCGVSIGDTLAALHGTIGILTALYHRKVNGGQGQVMMDVLRPAVALGWATVGAREDRGELAHVVLVVHRQQTHPGHEADHRGTPDQLGHDRGQQQVRRPAALPPPQRSSSVFTIRLKAHRRPRSRGTGC